MELFGIPQVEQRARASWRAAGACVVPCVVAPGVCTGLTSPARPAGRRPAGCLSEARSQNPRAPAWALKSAPPSGRARCRLAPSACPVRKVLCEVRPASHAEPPCRDLRHSRQQRVELRPVLRQHRFVRVQLRGRQAVTWRSDGVGSVVWCSWVQVSILAVCGHDERTGFKSAGRNSS